MEYWWAYILVGLVCGVFSAVFGVGSGILMIPALVLLFASPQKSAQGVCLAVMVPMALVGAIRYKVNPAIEINMTVVLWLSLGAVVGALIGASIAAWVSGLVLRKLFAVIMIAVAIKMLMTPEPKKSPVAPAMPQATTMTTSAASATSGPPANRQR